MIIITLAKKPSKHSITHCSKYNGCGGLNIDASRVGASGGTTRSGQAEYPKLPDGREDRSGTWARTGHSIEDNGTGRWPANLLLSPTAQEVMDTSRYFKVF